MQAVGCQNNGRINPDQNVGNQIQNSLNHLNSAQAIYGGWRAAAIQNMNTAVADYQALQSTGSGPTPSSGVCQIYTIGAQANLNAAYVTQNQVFENGYQTFFAGSSNGNQVLSSNGTYLGNLSGNTITAPTAQGEYTPIATIQGSSVFQSSEQILYGTGSCASQDLAAAYLIIQANNQP